MKTYVFGYGSLMNKESLRETLPNTSIASWATLKGYRRAFNKRGKRYRYLNIVPDQKFSVRGVLIPVNEEELSQLREREWGYQEKDVSKSISPKPNARVLAFIAPPTNTDLPVSKWYLETIKAALTKEAWELWLRETDFCGADVKT